MTIHKNDPRLTAYALGELDPAEHGQVEALLRSSPEASLLVAQIRQQASELRLEFSSEAVPARVLPSRPLSDYKRFFYFGGAGVVMAAIVSLSFLGGGVLNRGGESQRRAKVILDPPSSVEVSAEFPDVKIDLDGRDARISADLDALLVRSAVQSHSGDVRRCFSAAKSDVMDGIINIEMRIDREGRVDRVVVGENTMRSGVLADCLVEGFKGWRFPKAVSDSGDVVYPVRFFH